MDKKNELSIDYNYQTIKVPRFSNWYCHLFGVEDGLGLNPVVGQVPCWFWRKMQYLILGNKWVKKNE